MRFGAPDAFSEINNFELFAEAALRVFAVESNQNRSGVSKRPTQRRRKAQTRPGNRKRFKKRVGSKRSDPMVNWTWGLSLIALTMAMHATGIAFMAFAQLRIWHRMESLSRLRLHHWFAIVVPVINRLG